MNVLISITTSSAFTFSCSTVSTRSNTWGVVSALGLVLSLSEESSFVSHSATLYSKSAASLSRRPSFLYIALWTWCLVTSSIFRSLMRYLRPIMYSYCSNLSFRTSTIYSMFIIYCSSIYFLSRSYSWFCLSRSVAASVVILASISANSATSLSRRFSFLYIALWTWCFVTSIFFRESMTYLRTIIYSYCSILSFPTSKTYSTPDMYFSSIYFSSFSCCLYSSSIHIWCSPSGFIISRKVSVSFAVVSRLYL